MIFADYKENVKRTLPDMGSFRDNPLILNSLHMSLGMCSELYELTEALNNKDIPNIGEELTDIAWYASNYCNIRDISCIEIQNISHENIDIDERDMGEIHVQLVNAISEIQDYDKKEFAYNKANTDFITARRHACINRIMACLSHMYTYAKLNAEQQMQNNIDKLRVRFPDKFNDFDANNRSLHLERKELEK